MGKGGAPRMRAAAMGITKSRAQEEEEEDLNEENLATRWDYLDNVDKDSIFGLGSPFRIKVRKIVKSQPFDWFITFIIMINCAFLSTYLPLDPPDSARNKLLNSADQIFTIVFTVEMCFKILAFGVKIYASDNWNRLDMVVVVSGLITLFLGDAVSNLSSIRTMRVLRPLRTITVFPGLRVLVSTILSSIPMIFNVLIVCFYLFILFGILGVQNFEGQLANRCVEVDATTGNVTRTIHGELVLEQRPTQDEVFCSISTKFWHGQHCSSGYECRRVENPNYGITGFDNLLQAFLAIFQVITLEQWVDIMYITQDTTQGWSFLYFVVLVFVGAFFLVNLALAVITGIHDQAVRAEKRRKKRAADRAAWLAEHPDEPMHSGPEKEPETVGEAFLSGLKKTANMAVDLEKGAHNMATSAVNSASNMVMNTGVMKGTGNICKRFIDKPAFASTITSLIMLNTALLSLEYHGQPKLYGLVLEYANQVLALIFVGEMLIKMLGLGLRQYFKDKFNAFDFVVNLSSIAELAFGGTGGGSSLTALRAFRILRVLKLAGSWKSLQDFLETLQKTVLELGNFTFIVLLVIFIYALLGMQLFGGKFDFDGEVPRHNFDSLLWASVTVFQVLTGEDWPVVMTDTVRATSWVATLYSISLVLIGNYVVINLFIAILLSSFATHRQQEAEDKSGIKRATLLSRIKQSQQYEKINALLDEAKGPQLRAKLRAIVAAAKRKKRMKRKSSARRSSDPFDAGLLERSRQPPSMTSNRPAGPTSPLTHNPIFNASSAKGIAGDWKAIA
eukprot:CAMPEP_0182878560 /NCGR_PEP_ID=MMETSP0034_2-20130328/15427_1 /TAXON_ID=156128 /ORGANISM="Nephroselmis pyriformis, Strain CCMP717" /LENGTH=787 /DNA_ID=CAMNT_0025011449 /DNA_START=233 /DNA_END=2593 /DNA_ORIENTATION=+